MSSPEHLSWLAIAVTVHSAAVAGPDASLPDLSSLTADDFEPHQGESFVVGVEGPDSVAFRLTTVDRLGQGRGHRDPFSLLFAGPPMPVLPQAVYRLEHPTMGELELFLVPIGADQDAVTYEAVFA